MGQSGAWQPDKTPLDRDAPAIRQKTIHELVHHVLHAGLCPTASRRHVHSGNNWFLNASVPAGQTIQFKFIKICGEWGCKLGKRIEPHLYGTQQRHWICECELAVLKSGNTPLGLVAKSVVRFCDVHRTPRSCHLLSRVS
jgi:hypothetical protein